MLALWNAGDLVELQVSIVLILGLAVGNFFLHTRVLTGRAVSPWVVYAASAADLTVISLVLVVSGGFGTSPYVFYFPAILALSVAFPTRLTVAFTGVAIAAYGLVSMATATGSEGAIVVAQMLMLVAVAFCGNAYWRIERDRRGATCGTLGTINEPIGNAVPTR